MDQIHLLEQKVELERTKSQLEFLQTTDVTFLEEQRLENQQKLSTLDEHHRNILTRKQTVETLRVPYKNTLETNLEDLSPKINR
ncbi:hypothetical protein [Brevibacillus laterosporus]|uniref:hypothetical protein n=1 Tax=Brevibacillus laterosporus TaxID=1465 RepID=UPI00265D0DDD|nr:hypothetical protein [Brevibacillus laterosporus]